MKIKIKNSLVIIIFSFFAYFSNIAHASFLKDALKLFSHASSTASSSSNLNSSNLLKPTTSSSKSASSTLSINNKGAMVVNSGPMRVSTEKEKMTEDSITLYEVKKGDTLDTVAKLFNISKNTIIWANNLKNKNLTPGTSLIILPITGIQYTATKPVSLDQIAKKYNTDISEIAEFNGISPSTRLAKGQSIIIPDVEGDIYVSDPSNKNSKSTAKKIQYKINTVLGFFMKPVSCIKTQGLHGPFHSAVDFGCHPGTPVAAAADGVVIRSSDTGYNGGYGEVVIISHSNGAQTIYAHMSKVNVNIGDRVFQGQIIGATGNTGRSTGPHLHFETRGTANPFG